jgi:hypothetical protein
MTAVIAFPIRIRTETAGSVSRGPAQVIIFNGVRQEPLRDDMIARTRHIPRNRHSSHQNQATAEELD